ncbi:hypothetical protein M427DRAFT_30502 [Gonapodya prolifera JEL478]|uniref:Uncharacterized protein n=1 Tax=Gonapodya prolifera (strain JEL478) TaxID=1344416 RepID=A0A139AKR6_GONPJ|nr:hypothetical protein M427DRAFT_30502 [Gonapodya prolifera JEL478]|eukprot:KXS17367.1 hypothetical protein M427DRAFT_30502 [Gonapodya prolifera JEL478]
MAGAEFTNLVDPAETEVRIQVYVKSVVLARYVAESPLRISIWLLNFANWVYILAGSAGLPGILEVFECFHDPLSMISALVVFISDNYACNPALHGPVTPEPLQWTDWMG